MVLMLCCIAIAIVALDVIARYRLMLLIREQVEILYELQEDQRALTRTYSDHLQTLVTELENVITKEKA